MTNQAMTARYKLIKSSGMRQIFSSSMIQQSSFSYSSVNPAGVRGRAHSPTLSKAKEYENHSFILIIRIGNKSETIKSRSLKSKSSLLNKTQETITASAPLKNYNLQEELAGKYGKSHVIKVTSLD